MDDKINIAAQVQDVWNHCVSDMIRKAMDAKDYLEKYMDDNDAESDMYIQQYMNVSSNVNGLMKCLKFTSCQLVSVYEFSLWTRVKWNEYYSEFHFQQSTKQIQVRLNILFIDIYYLILNGTLTKQFDDRLIFEILDFLPRIINDNNNYTLLLEDYKFKNAIKGRDVDILKKIAKRCKLPVEAMYYMLDIFELFQKEQKWIQYIKSRMHQQNKSEITEQIALLQP
eukprot:318489_1